MADLTDEEFFALYGPWDPLDPAGVVELMDGFAGPWWIAGGQAVEAYTGVSRAHEDVDVSFFLRDLDALRDHLAPTYHLWSVGSGMLRPVTDAYPRLHAESAQVWIREHALAPWRADLLANVDVHGDWEFKRDRSFVAPLEDVTWVRSDGIRFLRPEIVLGHKIALSRPKDHADFEAAWPLLDEASRARLRDLLVRRYPDHPWRARTAR